MNTKAIIDEITKLEREKAQLEVRDEQLKKEKARIEEQLKAKGLTVKDLDGRIAELTQQINDELAKLSLTHLAGTAKTAVAAGDIDEFESI